MQNIRNSNLGCDICIPYLWHCATSGSAIRKSASPSTPSTPPASTVAICPNCSRRGAAAAEVHGPGRRRAPWTHSLPLTLRGLLKVKAVALASCEEMPPTPPHTPKELPIRGHGRVTFLGTPPRFPAFPDTSAYFLASSSISNSISMENTFNQI